MTTRTSQTSKVEANIQHRVRLTGEDATLVTQTWIYSREDIRVDMIVEMVTLYTDEHGSTLRYTVRGYGPIQTKVGKRDHAKRRGDVSWRSIDDVPMVLLRHLRGQVALTEELVANLHAAAAAARTEVVL